MARVLMGIGLGVTLMAGVAVFLLLAPAGNAAAPAVEMSELNGHYLGLVPNAGDPERRASTDDFMYNENSERGYWLGKAYQPTDATTGEGYNRV